MKKAGVKMSIADQEITGGGSFEARGFIPSLNEIEEFILDAGSDHIRTFGGRHEGGIQCQQIPDELAACVLYLLETGKRIETYLEIGVAAGGTTFIFNHFLHPETVVLIDDNAHWKAHLRDHIIKDVPHIDIIGNSQVPETVARLAALGMTFDLIIIDGGHTYEAVKQDFENYQGFLRAGGFLLFHDSAIPDWGVFHLVGQVKQEPGFEFVLEFVSTKKDPPCGLSLFRKVAE